MKTKGLFRTIFSMMLVSILLVSTVTNAYAATGSKKVTSTGSMSVALTKGSTGDSSTVSFNVSGLPANAKITKIEVYTGSLTYTGAVLTNYLTLQGKNSGITEQIAWNGAANKTLTASNFKATTANDTYTISFNSTCFGGEYVNGILTNLGTKKYTRPYIVVYWDDTL